MVALGYASTALIEDGGVSSRGSSEISAVAARLRFVGFILSTWPYSVINVVFRQINDLQSAVNGILLISSMAFCVLPTICHVMLLMIDILRFILKRICQNSLSLDSLAHLRSAARSTLLFLVFSMTSSRMLRRRFGDTSGRPYMEGYVLLPRLGWSGKVSFIFDTGADTSLLMPLDAQRRGIDYGLFESEVSTLGIGGTSDNFVEAVYLAFVGEEALYGH